MKLLVFGGSFDPPHLGHSALLKAAAKRIGPDRIVIVPAFHAPLKGAPRASAADRLEMVRIGLIPSLPRRWRKICRIDQGEMRSRRRVYSFETLQRLKKKAELHFVVGSDSAASFWSWKSPKALLSLCDWWTAARPGHAGVPAHFKRVPGAMPDLSSTRIRAALSLGKEEKGRLEPAVSAYITRRGLYGAALLERLERSLKPERFAHTLAVADLAGRLARNWKLDEEKARLAGLLHDCGRAVAVPDMPEYARRHGIAVPDLEGVARHNPLLAHAYISAYLARRRFRVSDPAVLSAIRKHTLGDETMSDLDRLLYVADASSEDRAHAEAARARRLAFQDPEEAFKACVRGKIAFALSKQAWLHPLTIRLWNSLLEA